MSIGIYKIINPNGKIYVGQSVSIETRWKEHIQIHEHVSNTKISRSIKKYGPENHIFEVQEECEVNLLNERERYWQEFFEVLGPNGLNLKYTKTNDRSGHYSEELKDRMRGLKRSEEYREKIKIINTGRIRNDNTKIKMREAKLGKPSNRLGKFQSKETRLKISKSNKGRIHSEEHKIKIGLGNIGRIRKEGTGEKIAGSLRGKTRSKETKQKMREAKLGKPGNMLGKFQSEETK